MKRSRMTGADDIAAVFKTLPRGMGPAYNEASRKALAPQLSAAKRNLKANGSVESGEFSKALTIRRDPKSPQSRPVHYVGPRRSSPAFRRGHLIEFGTSPHFIGPESGAGWQHPGASPRPFLTPAFTHHWRESLDIFGDVIGPLIEARAAKLATRKSRR